MVFKLIRIQVQLPLKLSLVEDLFATHIQVRKIHFKHEMVSSAMEIKKRSLNRAINDAEQLIDYPSSFSNLNWIFDNKSTNLVVHIRKLIGTKHPLPKTLKQIIYAYSDKSRLHNWGLLPLLLSKAGGYPSSVPKDDIDPTIGILYSQRSLVHTSVLIGIIRELHRSIFNLNLIDKSDRETDDYDDMVYGNKISLIVGDFLLAKSFEELANIRNHNVFLIMLLAARDFMSVDFFGDHGKEDNSLPFEPRTVAIRQTTTKSSQVAVNPLAHIDISSTIGNPEKEWEGRNLIEGADLIGKCCQGSQILAGQNEDMQQLAYDLGKHLFFACQASLDVRPFQRDTLPLGSTLSLISAPMLFHLENDGSLYEEIKKGKDSAENICYQKVHRAILNGPGLERTRELKLKHTSAGMDILEKLPESNAKAALKNIVKAMQEM